MELKCWRYDLRLNHPWAISRGTGSDIFKSVLLELTDHTGTTGRGEASPIRRYDQSVDTVAAFCAEVDPRQLSFDDLPSSLSYLDRLTPGNPAARCAFDVALMDGAARKAGKALCDLLGLGFREGRHVTSFSIGIADPETIQQKVREAGDYPILKLKMGVAGDRANFAALRAAAPAKTVRVDANEGWTTKEQALEMLEWLAADGKVEFVEQPMPAQTSAADLKWLKERSPLPLFADESYLTQDDLVDCVGCFHGVNVKLAKTGGVTGALAALQAARQAGLQTMIGCMIESSVGVSAGAQLAELAQYLDLDGNLLISNDPYFGPTTKDGVISFAQAPEKTGLRVLPRQP